MKNDGKTNKIKVCLNVLYFLFADDPEYIFKIKYENWKMKYGGLKIEDENALDPRHPDVREMRLRDSYIKESQILNHSSAKRFREQLVENESFQDFLGDQLLGASETLPVALMTFVLSVFIATDKSLRDKFYDYAKGKKIPAITQWCLQTFTLSPISDTATVTGFRYHDDYDTTVECCNLQESLCDNEYLRYRDKEIALWFSLLEENFNSDELNYLSHVYFNNVPKISRAKNYLCGLTVDEHGNVNVIDNAYFHELTEDKKAVYKMLANVLDAVIVPENNPFLIMRIDFVAKFFDSEENTVKLIDFIAYNCVDFL